MPDESIVNEVITITACTPDETPEKKTPYLRVTDHAGRDLSLYDRKLWDIAKLGIGQNFEAEIKGPNSKYPQLRKLELTDKSPTPITKAESGSSGRSSGGGGSSAAKDRSIERQVALKETGDTVRLLISEDLVDGKDPEKVRRAIIMVFPAFAFCVHGQQATPQAMQDFVDEAQQTLEATVVEDYGTGW